MAQQQPAAVPNGLAADRQPGTATPSAGPNGAASEPTDGLAVTLLRPYDAEPPPEPEVEPLLRKMKHRNPKADLVLVRRAYEVADQKHGGQRRKSGLPYIANPLGVHQVKWELEDLALAALYPKRYVDIVRMTTERQPEREKYLAKVIEQVNAQLKTLKIRAEVTGRPKHYYSIYEKMVLRGKEFSDIFDLLGVRVLTDSIKDCYAALGQVHALWKPVPGRFKDYIAMPKFNLYQSLRTTVVGPEGKPLEIQIRTKSMHQTAEY